MLRRTLEFFCLLFGLLAVTASSIHADETTPQDNRWAIAIHGGAGGDPARWDDAKRVARLAGLERALQTGRDILADRGAAMDAVENVIRLLEDDASFNAGRGAVLTEDGNAELDASIMDGKTRGCGGVAGVTNVKNPISLARRVMTETKHVLLIGPGAEQFAAEQQVPLVAPDYFLSRHPRRHGSTDPQLAADPNQPHFGTVGCVALDVHGNLAAGTSTGGTAKKLPGRVGDSPIIGAGTFASNETCAVSGTGIGEEYIRNAVAYDIVAQMKYAGRSLDDAVTEVMVHRLNKGVGGLIAVSRDGGIVMQHNTPGMSCGGADSQGRFETHLVLKNEDARNVVAPHHERIEKQLTRQLKDQAASWNDGDIDRFMEVYWRSDELTFSSGGKVTRGWDATLAGYKKRYPTPEAMGKLTFSELEFLPLGDSAMQVLGVWQLKRDSEPIGGRFTLVFRRISAGWRIVHDHTSQWPQSPSP